MPPIAPRADAAQRRVGDCAGERTRALHVREQRLAAARGLGLRLVPVQQHNVVELPAAPGRAVSALPASSGSVGVGRRLLEKIAAMVRIGASETCRESV
mgnify:FL=1